MGEGEELTTEWDVMCVLVGGMSPPSQTGT